VHDVARRRSLVLPSHPQPNAPYRVSLATFSQVSDEIYTDSPKIARLMPTTLTPTPPRFPPTRARPQGLSGTVIRGPVLHRSGVPRAEFVVAVRPFAPRGAPRPAVEHHIVIALGRLALAVSAQVKVGDRIVVAGRRNERRWTDRNGVPRMAAELVADEAGIALSATLCAPETDARTDHRRPAKYDPTEPHRTSK